MLVHLVLKLSFIKNILIDGFVFLAEFVPTQLNSSPLVVRTRIVRTRPISFSIQDDVDQIWLGVIPQDADFWGEGLVSPRGWGRVEQSEANRRGANSTKHDLTPFEAATFIEGLMRQQVRMRTRTRMENENESICVMFVFCVCELFGVY